MLFSFSFFFFFPFLFSFIALADSAKGQQGTEQEEGENCLMTEARMSLPFPLQSFLSPAPFPPNKSLLTPSLAGWEGVRVAVRTSVLGGEELGTWLGHWVTMPVLLMDRCGWVDFVGWGKKKKTKTSSFQARLA